MEFDVTLDITDECTTNGNCSKVEKEVTVTSTSDTIQLQCRYILNVIAVNDNSITVLIQNGYDVFIRVILFDVEFRICLPCCNSKQLVTITATNNNDNS